MHLIMSTATCVCQFPSRSTLPAHFFPTIPQKHTMAEEQLPLTDPYFATEDESNIANNTDNQVIHEERSEVVCGGMGQRRTQGIPHQTSETSQSGSETGSYFGAIHTNENTTNHSLPHTQLLPPLITTTFDTPVIIGTTSHFSCEHLIEEKVDCIYERTVPVEAVGDPPPTQQLVSGMMT